MQRHQRRPGLTARSTRAATNRIPAYQLRRQRLSAEAVERPAARNPQAPPAIRLSHTTSDWHVDRGDGADGNGHSVTPAEDQDYADYRESVEAAAARNRAELLGGVGPRLRPAPAVAAATAGAGVMLPPARATGGRGGTRGPRRRTARGRRERPRDPRPVFKRPKTWFILAAMVPVLASIVALFYFGNLLKTSYDTYNKVRAPLPAGPVYTVNEQGTPVVVPTEQVQQALPDWGKKEPFNILLLGTDPRPTDIDPPRSDTIIVVHVNPATEQVTMMTIPRDLWVNIPGVGWDKINAAYAIGEARKDTDVPGGGPQLVEQTIGANFGIIINYYATVDFAGFRTIVDTIGGIVIDVPAPLKDDLYPTENLGVTRIFFETGLQKLNGEQALEYARTRHGDNDIARGDRQQQVLLAIREQAVSLGLITKADQLIQNVGDSVRTDLNFNQMLALANLGRKIDASKITKVNLWDAGALSEHTPVDDTDPFYWQADWGIVYGLMDQYFNAGTDAGSATATPTTGVGNATATRPNRANVDLNAAVVVQNASNVNLLATNAVQLLRDAGFANATPDTADAPTDTTVIYDNSVNPATARYIAQTLGIADTAILPNPDPQAADIVVVLGADAPVNVIQGP